MEGRVRLPPVSVRTWDDPPHGHAWGGGQPKHIPDQAGCRGPVTRYTKAK